MLTDHTPPKITSGDSRCRMDNSQAQSFACQKKFFDDRNYPHGFQRSGDFTRTQAQLLESKGVAMKALHEGSRQPQTAEEEHFVAVCQGKESATTDIEKTWALDRKSTRLNSSHVKISYAVFCLKKKKKT